MTFKEWCEDRYPMTTFAEWRDGISDYLVECGVSLPEKPTCKHPHRAPFNSPREPCAVYRCPDCGFEPA